MAVQLGDILEFSLQGTLYSQRVLTVLHYRVDVVPTIHTDSLDSQDDFLQRVKQGGVLDKVQPYLNCISNNYTLDNIVAQYVYPVRYRRSVLVQGLAGGRVGAANTSNTSAVIEKTSRLAGRANRGSVHIPGIVNSDYTTGIIQAPLLALMSTLASAWTLSVTEGGGGAGLFVPIIFHRKNPGTTSQIWSDWTIQSTLRTMRRRTVGVGK